MSLFCVFTPTYNRAYTLERLYDSLVNQTCKDFTWLIVDDGSTDNTPQLVQSFIGRNEMRISYIRTENRGKSRALNTGITLCSDELFFCVDSDDWLTPDALEILKDRWDIVKDDKSIGGMLALRGIDSEHPIGTGIPHGLTRDNVWSLYFQHGFHGDAAHIYRTEVFRRYPSEVAPGEKFISEGWTVYQIAEKYDVSLINRIIYIGGYLSDGYTSNVRKLTKDNPIGYYRFKLLCLRMPSSFLLKQMNTILFMTGHKLAHNSFGIEKAPNKFMAFIGVIPAWILVKTVYR